jgi:hypothetical protein
MAPAVCSTPRAAAVAELGAKKWREGKAINADDHRPIYLKKSQAEQEREAGNFHKGASTLVKSRLKPHIGSCMRRRVSQSLRS